MQRAQGDPATHSSSESETQADRRPRWQYREKLTAEDVEAIRRELPAEVVEAHLRWLETGEGDPWGESSD